MTDDRVILDIKTYDRFRNASTKANLVIDRLFELSKLDPKSNKLVFNNEEELSELLKLAYPDRYKNRVEDLKTSEGCGE